MDCLSTPAVRLAVMMMMLLPASRHLSNYLPAACRRKLCLLQVTNLLVAVGQSVPLEA